MIAMLDIDRLAEAPMGLLLILKATAVLAAAWLACAALARANPRWRVLTWRAAVAGLAAVAGFAIAPPLVTWRVPALPREEGPAHPLPTPTAESGPSLHEALPPPGSTPAATARAEDLARPTRATAPIATPAEPIDVATWLTAAWLAGVAAGLVRFAVGSRALARIVRRSSAAPTSVVEACRATAEALGVRRAVRIVVAPGVTSPCLAGVIRPTILLPAGMGLDAPGPDLDAVLVHELTHVRNGDLIWNDALQLASIALWFHPLAWRIRAAHAAACDAVCDAVAVDRLGDVATYGRALARLALRASAPSRGLAMARACDVRRRVESLQRMVYRSPLPRRLVMPALLLSAALAALVGGAAVIRAHEEPANPDEPAKSALTVRVIDAATGRPLEGVEVESSFFEGEAEPRKPTKATATTGADGVVRVEHRPDARPSSLWLIARKPGFVPGGFHRGSGRAESFPMPESKEFRLARGTELGGVVVDEAGTQIEGANVKLSMPFADSDSPILYGEITTVKTDARGRWRSNELPGSLGNVHINVSHPGYLGASVEAVRGDLRTVLTKGETVTGRVVGPDGRPIAGMKVGLRRSVFSATASETTTDAEGRFALPHAEPGEAYVTVEADGFAPAFRQVVVKPGAGAEGVEIAMEPGATLRVRAVDAEGRPLPGVQFSPFGVSGKQWSRFRATTDAEGRASWKDAPRRAWEYSFHKQNLMTSRVQLVPDGEERAIVMRPPLVVTGSVIDAVTRRPIPKFRVEYGTIEDGRTRPYWQSDAKDGTDGRYSMTFDFPQTYAIRVIAHGYKTAVSPAFPVDDPGATTRDFALEPQPWLEGVVRRPGGSPDATAQVALLTPQSSARLDGTTFAKGLLAPIVAVDAEGRYAFPPPEPPFLLAAVSAAGYVEAKPEDFAKSSDLTLRPWGRIEGTVRIGEKPGAGERIQFRVAREEPGVLWVDADLKVQADARGRYVFERVVPGLGDVGRGGGVAREAADVKPGETIRVDIGGGGRPLVGRAIFDGPVDWTRNRPARIGIEPGAVDLSAVKNLRYSKILVGTFDRDGRFRIEDVPPGRHRLTIQVDPLVPAEPQPRMKPTGKAVRSIVVPPGDLATPVDLGEIVARPSPDLGVGDPAPALDLERIDDAKGRYVLADRRGRLVVLVFWASWAKPLATLMPILKELEKAHGGDPRFELVGVSCDDDPAEAARFARGNGLSWTQVFAGPIGEKTTADFGITNPSSIVIVGPDGRILARGVLLKQIQDEVTKALAGMEPSSTR